MAFHLGFFVHYLHRAAFSYGVLSHPRQPGQHPFFRNLSLVFSCDQRWDHARNDCFFVLPDTFKKRDMRGLRCMCGKLSHRNPRILRQRRFAFLQIFPLPVHMLRILCECLPWKRCYIEPCHKYEAFFSDAFKRCHPKCQSGNVPTMQCHHRAKVTTNQIRRYIVGQRCWNDFVELLWAVQKDGT